MILFSEGRAPAFNESLDIPPGHFCSYTLVFCPMPTSKARDWSSRMLWHSVNWEFNWSTCRILRLEVRRALDVTPEEPPHGTQECAREPGASRARKGSRRRTLRASYSDQRG